MNKVLMYRTGAGFTQLEMANMLGMALNTYRAKESDPSKFTLQESNKFVLTIKQINPDVKFEDIFLN